MDAETRVDLVKEVRLLRDALLPFARRALTRSAAAAPDDQVQEFTMAECKAALAALNAE